MSRADDIAACEKLVVFLAQLSNPTGAYSIKVDALARVLPDAIAALRFVEEHGERAGAALESYERNARAIQHLTDDGPARAAEYAGALEALRRLTGERGEP